MLDFHHGLLEQFNVRFPRADGLQRFSFKVDAPDPLEDIRAITQARAEADQRALNEYQSSKIPLSFVAALVGKDPLDAWGGLPSVKIQFQVCRGTLPERLDVLRTIEEHGRKGCVLDAITLSVVRHLDIAKPLLRYAGQSTHHNPLLISWLPEPWRQELMSGKSRDMSVVVKIAWFSKNFPKKL